MSATTPTHSRPNMPVSRADTLSKASPRRALSNLTPKALNAPASHANKSEGVRTQNPLKQTHMRASQLFVGKENAVRSEGYVPGKKRGIQEVDDVEDVDVKARLTARQFGSQVALTTAAVGIFTHDTAVDLPVAGSPTERNTPTPELEDVFEVGNSQDTQASKESFSSFINYGACASQNNERQPAPPLPPPPPQPIEPGKKSRAELLRTRLGFGIYKVKTDQVAKSGSDIISHWESSFSGASINASTSDPLSESISPHRLSNATLPPVCHEYHPVFVKANLDPGRPVGKLTPAPILLPTATSSRIVHDYQMPSSPPEGSVSPAQLISSTKQCSDQSTPVPGRMRNEDDAEGDGTAQDGLRRMQRFQEGDLANPGLIGLMAGPR